MARRVRGWLTADSFESDNVCRSLTIPHWSLWNFIDGALSLLTDPYNWEQSGDLTPDEMAEIFSEVLENFREVCMNCDELRDCLYGSNSQFRMNPTTGALESSTDGGVTWNEDTVHDPRYISPRMGITGADDCTNAKYIIGQIQSVIDQTKDIITAGSGIAGLVGVLTTVIATILSAGILAPLLVGFGGAVLGFSTAAIDAALTNAVWARLLENIYCTIQDATEITEAMWQEILQNILDDETGIAETILWNAVNLLGPVGLQNAIAMAIPGASLPADCSAIICGEFCTQINFATDQRGWVNGTSPIGTYEGRYVAGSGWGCKATSEVIGFQYDLGADTHLTHIKATVIGTGGPSVAYDGVGFLFYKDGVQVLSITNANTHQNWNLDQVIDVVADKVYFSGNVSVAAPGSFLNYRVTFVEFAGEGGSPFIGTDCP